jgi:ABC-type antimicrobial peptide transport system permease subunit
MLNEALVVAPGAAGLDYWVRNRFRRSLVALQAISFLALLVSCLNVANLLLARGLQRQRETAVRLALGAKRWQIVRELIAEIIVLIAAGLAGSLFLADAADGAFLALLSRGYSGFALTANPDMRVLLFMVRQPMRRRRSIFRIGQRFA